MITIADSDVQQHRKTYIASSADDNSFGTIITGNAIRRAKAEEVADEEAWFILDDSSLQWVEVFHVMEVVGTFQLRDIEEAP